MAKRVYIGRYAQAVFNIARETDQLDRWQSDLQQVACLGEDATLVALLQDPRLSFDDKAKLLSRQLRKINPLVLNLVYLLLTRGKLGIVGNIAAEYQRLLNRHRGIEEAEVTTAIPLDDEDKLSLEKRLSAVIGKKVVVKSEVDSSIVGGFVARIGDKLLDGSTRSQLLALKRELGG